MSWSLSLSRPPWRRRPPPPPPPLPLPPRLLPRSPPRTTFASGCRLPLALSLTRNQVAGMESVVTRTWASLSCQESAFSFFFLFCSYPSIVRSCTPPSLTARRPCLSRRPTRPLLARAGAAKNSRRRVRALGDARTLAGAPHSDGAHEWWARGRRQAREKALLDGGGHEGGPPWKRPPPSPCTHMQSPPSLASLTNIVTRPPRYPLPAPPRPSSVPVLVWWARRAASCAYREGGAPVHAVARLPEWASRRQAVHGEFGAGARPGVPVVSPPLPPTANGNRGDGAGRAQRALCARGAARAAMCVGRVYPPATSDAPTRPR